MPDKMRVAIGLPGNATDEHLQYARQMGCEGVVLATPARLPGEQGWEEADLVRLREWGADRVHPLPGAGEGVIGAEEGCQIRLADATGRVSRRHARVWREREGWMIEDTGSRNGLRIDGVQVGPGARRLEPGVELGIGGLTLIAESSRLIALRGFLARVLGWTSEQTAVVDHALRSIRMAARSPGFSSTGPDVARTATPSSLPITYASVVLPRPGGP